MMARIQSLLGLCGPVRATFVVSLLLSWLAVQGRIVNRDGIYYLDTARTILEEGLGAVMRVGEWNFLPALVAAVSAATPLGLEAAAQTLNGLLLAGTCALLVDWVRRRAPEAAWFAVLAVLAMPAYNQYRNEILREYGFWFFSMLGFWLAMRWTERRGVKDLLWSQLAILTAALFRLEAAAFFLALMAWQMTLAVPGSRLRTTLVSVALPTGALVLGALLVLAGVIELPRRILYYLSAADPIQKTFTLSDAAARLSDKVLPYKYSREEAIYILSIGLLSIIPIKFLKMMGLLLVPFAYRFKDGGFRKILAPWQPLPWAFAVYVLVLAAFVTQQMFLVGRYVSILNLLAVPLVAVGFAQLAARHERWQPLFAALALAMVAANVVSLTPRQTQIIEAGNWLRQHAAADLRVGMENGRVAYYAGWKLARANYYERQALADELASGRLDLAAFEIDRKETETDAWLMQKRLVEMRRFVGPKGDMVILAAPAAR